jgi:hypothetical protein
MTAMGFLAITVRKFCARARWMIENESFNVLNNGYNLAHNFGDGKKYLAAARLSYSARILQL